MPYSVLISLVDGKNETGVVTIPIPDTTTATNAIAFGSLIFDLVQGLTSGGNLVAKVIFDIPGLVSNNPLGASDVQEIGKFVFRGVTGFLKSLGIPAFTETKFVPGSDQIDVTDVDVAAFVTAMTDGIDTTPAGGNATIQPCDIRGVDLDELVSAAEAWGKKRK